MTKTRLIVIGAGHLGRIHARLARQLDEAQLVGVVDPDDGALSAVRKELAAGPRRAAGSQTDGPETDDPETGGPQIAGLQIDSEAVEYCGDWRSLAASFDGAIVAAPTVLHHALGIQLLQAGKDVLMEKPIAATEGEADQLVSLAEQRGRVLQVGHVERFNPAFQAAVKRLGTPKLIQACRQGAFTGRSTDVSVVLDLMIHDLDLAMSLAAAPVASVEASGGVVVGPLNDLAEARLTFENGVVARLSASRVADSPRRQMHVLTADSQVVIDFAARASRVSLATWPGEVGPAANLSADAIRRRLEFQPLEVPDQNALLEEQRDFVAAIARRATPRVDGRHGAAALRIAHRIERCIAAESAFWSRRTAPRKAG